MFAGDDERKQEPHRRQPESKQKRQPKSEIHRQRPRNLKGKRRTPKGTKQPACRRSAGALSHCCIGSCKNSQERAQRALRCNLPTKIAKCTIAGIQSTPTRSASEGSRHLLIRFTPDGN
jgi:hypothetical protein